MFLGTTFKKTDFFLVCNILLVWWNMYTVTVLLKANVFFLIFRYSADFFDIAKKVQVAHTRLLSVGFRS